MRGRLAELKRTLNNRFDEVNERIGRGENHFVLANATARMPIFRYYDVGETVHSGSDGQKFESAIPTVNSRHSSKYFGLKESVVDYKLLASHVPLSARITGTNEHESQYVFGVLFNNHTDIQPQMHLTDRHGTNQANLALLHLFGCQSAPRYRDFQRQVRTGLYTFEPLKDNVGSALKPVRRINERLTAS